MHFFLHGTPTSQIYALSLHDALPISRTAGGGTRGWRGCSPGSPGPVVGRPTRMRWSTPTWPRPRDRKSTRLNSSHPSISYAVFCLKKKNNRNLRLHNMKYRYDVSKE